MTTYTYLGYGTTDSTGKCKLDHDANGNAISHSYTGTGAGEIDIVASTDHPITGGSIQSEIYEVYDCTKYDTGIDGTATDIYTGTSTSAMTRTSSYTSLKEVTLGTPVLTNIEITPSCIVDFECCVVDGAVNNGVFYIYKDSSNLFAFTLGQMGYTSSVIGEWKHFRMSITGTNATITDLDDPTKTKTSTGSFANVPNRMRFYTGGEITEVRWRNVKVYPV